MSTVGRTQSMRLFGGAFLLALVASGGVLVERVSRGDIRIAAVAMLGLLVAAALVFLAFRRTTPNAISPQLGVCLAGAAVGIALVHVVIRLVPGAWTRGLIESPAQLVNDIVAAGSVVLLVASLATPSALRRTLLALAVFAALAAYRFTAGAWHVDALVFTGMTVQQYVAAEVIAIASGLLVLDLFAPSAKVSAGSDW